MNQTKRAEGEAFRTPTRVHLFNGSQHVPLNPIKVSQTFQRILKTTSCMPLIRLLTRLGTKMLDLVPLALFLGGVFYILPLQMVV